MEDRAFSDDDYRAIAAFRAGLRRFLRFSEDAARAAGLSPQQHQLLLSVRGHAGADPPTIGQLAEALQIRHHSTVGLVDRMEHAGYVRREGSVVDNRRVHVVITPAGESILRSLTAAHQREHRHLREALLALTADVDNIASAGAAAPAMTAAPADPGPGGDEPAG